MLLGVDRMDYTKGIVERLLALEYLLEEHPWYIEKLCLFKLQHQAARTYRVTPHCEIR